MPSRVTITGDDVGNVIAVSQKNPEYGHIRVEQDVNEFTADGWLRLRKRSALIHGLMKDLQAAEFYAGQQLPGKIVVKESLMPFDLENPERNLKIAGESGIVCRVDDQPIYRQTFYCQDPNACDELIMHTNSEEIREVNHANRELRNFVLPTLQQQAVAL